METAENIGYSCRLLANDMTVIKCSNLEDVKSKFNEEKAKENKVMVERMVRRGILVEADALSKI